MPSIAAPMSPDPIHLWLVEDERSYREPFVALAAQTPGLELSRCFADNLEVEALLRTSAPTTPPHVVLMDYRMPGVDGIEATRRLRRALPGARVLFLTNTDDPAVIVRALRAGASGYVLKDTDADRLVLAIRETAAGGMLMPPGVAEHVLAEFSHEGYTTDGTLLSEREREVLRLMAEGRKQKEIAAELFLSTHTIDSHLRNVYQKLHVRSGVHAVAQAIRRNLL